MAGKVLLLAFLLQAATPEEVAKRVTALIELLRSDEIDQRDEATKQLKKIGTPAVAPLQALARDPDAELVSRAKTILDAIAADADPLRNPAAAAMNQKAPPEYKARFTTSKGDFVVRVTRDWAPIGADRFYNLVRFGYYDQCRFFRVIPGFMSQFGIHGDPSVSARWKQAKLDDDPVKEGNKRRRISFAMAGKNTRTTQLFINVKDNDRLDALGFAAFGEVSEGMEVVDQFHSGYGDGAPGGKGPAQARIQAEGNVYLANDFDKLDFIKSAKLVD